MGDNEGRGTGRSKRAATLDRQKSKKVSSGWVGVEESEGMMLCFLSISNRCDSRFEGYNKCSKPYAKHVQGITVRYHFLC